MSGAMQRETEKAEELDLEQKTKTTTIDDRLVVISYPGILSDEQRRGIELSLQDRLQATGLEALVLDAGAEVYRPSLLGQVSLQLSSLEADVAALAEMVRRLVGYMEAGEEEERPEQTLDGEIVGGPRDQSRSL